MAVRFARISRAGSGGEDRSRAFFGCLPGSCSKGRYWWKRDENPSLFWEKCIDKLCAVCYYFDMNNRLRKVKTTKQTGAVTAMCRKVLYVVLKMKANQQWIRKMEGRAHG